MLLFFDIEGLNIVVDFGEIKFCLWGRLRCLFFQIQNVCDLGPHLQAFVAEEVEQTFAVCNKKYACFLTSARQIRNLVSCHKYKEYNFTKKNNTYT